MPFKFTDEQNSAVTQRGNILVSAAAGSGKTAVLTERVINKLTSEEDFTGIDKLLIVTFTNAAAAEMRSRIEKRLFEECRKNPDNENLLRQKHLISTADICTIDSFCINLVRENFEKCGVEPNFSITNGDDVKEIKENILKEIVDGQLDKSSDEFNLLLKITDCDFDDKNLTDIIEKLYDYSRQMPFPDKFLDSLSAPYKAQFNSEHIWWKAIFDNANRIINEIYENLVELCGYVLNIETTPQKFDTYAKELSVYFDLLKTSIVSEDYDGVKELLTQTFNKAPNSSKDDVYTLKFKKRKEKIFSLLDDLNLIFKYRADEIISQNKQLLPAVTLLTDLVKEFADKYFAELNERNLLTFALTEQLAFSLICEQDENGEIIIKDEAKAYLLKYEEVLVDEYQDVNDLQNMLFYVLSNRDKNLFCVGDVKQSIYRFRGSNPENFLRKKDTYIPLSEAEKDASKKIILKNNFRSRESVCDFVNFVFSLIMTKETGEIVYGEDERLVPSSDFPQLQNDSAEILLVDTSEDTDDTALAVKEANAVADYIRSAVNGSVMLKGLNGGLRKCEYGDICILLEKTKTSVPIFVKALENAQIPVISSNDSFCDTPEIALALSLLSVLDNQSNDIEMLSVLASPLFLFTHDEIAVMRSQNKKTSIYSLLVSFANQGNTKAQKTLKTLNNLKNNMCLMSLDKFVLKMICDTDLLSIVSSMKNGEERRNNLLSLVSLAKQYEGKTAGEFVRYLRDLPENAFRKNNFYGNKVKIMSMHSSKGLQFPVCIIPQLLSRMNMADFTNKILFSEQYGINFKYYDDESGDDVQTAGKMITSLYARKKNAEERMRLLYVAMTRAEEKLVMVFTDSNFSGKLQKIADNVSLGGIDSQYVTKNIYLGNWILAALMLHPDGAPIRKAVEFNVSPLITNGNVNVSFVSKPEENITYSEDTADITVNEDLVNKIKNNISFEYPLMDLNDIKSKTSVSAVAKSQSGDNFAFVSMPGFMNKEKLTAAEKGTAVHNIMQFINMDERPDVKTEIERLVEWQYITQEQGECADVPAIEQFFDSDLFNRIKNSNSVNREMRFLSEFPASVVYNDVAKRHKDTPVIVQGAVDLCFAEDDGIVVVDFKTDRVNSEEELKELYSEQLNIYALACERLFSKKVKQKIIYSFALSKEIIL